MRKYKNNITFNVRNITLYKEVITLSLQNIILYLGILTGHLTERVKILILRFKNITLSFKIITFSLIILMLSLVNIISTSTYVPNVSALDYSSNIGVGFTFNPTLSISLSSSDLVIDNLVPGSTEDSNSINVSVATNAAYGYTLSATTDNENLVRSDNVDSAFSSISTNANLETLVMDNTWGYSYKNNIASTPTWSNYSGLVIGTNKVLLDVNDNNTETGIDSVDFKIGAKASSTQPSGIYTGTINFLAVVKPRPKVITDLEYMQDFAGLDETDLASVKSSILLHSTYILKDKRDEQEYTIAKLADGKIWMTKNLNLAGGTEITAELSDIPNNYTLPTTNGFQEGNRLPESSQEGFSDNTQAYAYNTNNSTDNCANPGCYSYYSWIAATVGSLKTTAAGGRDAPASICPAGWKIPNLGHRDFPEYQSTDFYQLAASYMPTESQNSINSSAFYNTAGIGTIPNFLLVGNYEFSRHWNGNSNGAYWSSTSDSYVYGFNFSFSRTNATIWNYTRRQSGMAVRCLAR